MYCLTQHTLGDGLGTNTPAGFILKTKEERKRREKKLSPPTARSINSLTPYRVKIQNYAQMVGDLHPNVTKPDHSSS